MAKHKLYGGSDLCLLAHLLSNDDRNVGKGKREGLYLGTNKIKGILTLYIYIYNNFFINFVTEFEGLNSTFCSREHSFGYVSTD
jgi:hypothetical protein